ncbi:MAG: regulator of protease activity HflC (stomatin/prohibitin superfamily) [Rickettsiales bacterium]|jgi:regulator of protease activity HflC (stomatin/prohibitin superfamily)
MAAYIILSLFLITLLLLSHWFKALCMGEVLIVYDFETGMLFRNGKFIKILNPGKHRIFSKSAQVMKIDTRPGQLSFSKTSVTKNRKIIDHNTIIKFKIERPDIFVNNNSSSVQDIVKDESQISIRDVFQNQNSDFIYLNRDFIENEINDNINKRLESRGVKILKTDIMIMSTP